MIYWRDFWRGALPRWKLALLLIMCGFIPLFLWRPCPFLVFFPKKLFQWFIPSRRQEVTTDRLWRLFWTFCFHIKSSSLPPQGSGITKLEITRPEGVELDYYLCSGLYSSFSPSEILYSTNSTRRLFSDQHKRIACFPNYKSTAAVCVCLDVLGAGRL